MATETLSFLCPHCDIRLTVPIALAGVKGPCPNCRMAITAPVPAEGPSPFEEVGPPTLSPLPTSTAPEQPQEREEPPVTAPVEVLPAAAPVGEEEPLVPDGPKIKPEPRKMKERGAAEPVKVRHSTADERMRRQSPIRAKNKRPTRLKVVLIPIVFFALASLVSGLLLYFYLPDGPWQTLNKASGPLHVAPPKSELAKKPPTPAPAPQPEPALPSPSSAGDPPAPAPVTPAPAATVVEDPIAPSVRATEALEAFLKAKDGKSRQALVEPEASLQDLQTWEVTRGPLWEVAQIFNDLPQHDPKEQVTDYPYRVSFFIPNRKNVEFAMIVRQRGEQAPRVFLPAFLDLAGGRLANFCREPNTQEPTTFRVVLEPVARCYEDNVPDPERKFTLKLLASTVGKETSRAYVSTGSRFKKMLDDPDSSLRWGTRLRSTVTLQWNHKENPEMPYLELIDINSLGWTP